jgi:tetratricopeptide (TPR) repeat protein
LAVGTLLLPLIVFPLYLVLALWIKKIGPPRRWRFLLPLGYAAVVLGALVIFYYFDSRRVDAHLARATRARLVEDYAGAIREYRQALALEDDPHTHKLLAIELANEHSFSQALSEFRLAQQSGEPDDSIHYQIGLLLERLDQTAQAKLEFQNFLLTDTCLHEDPRCEIARQRLETRQ